MAASASQLDRGQQYSVILSTGGGLYRYRLDDVVEVVGHHRQCPLVRFVGRPGHVSDWYGEKLSDAHVAGVLGNTFEALGLRDPRMSRRASPCPTEVTRQQ